VSRIDDDPHPAVTTGTGSPTGTAEIPTGTVGLTGADSPTGAESSAAGSSADARRDRQASGLPWSGGNVLTIDTDGTAFVDRRARPGMTGVWTIAAPAGTRSVTSALPLHNALDVPAYRALEAREWALGHDQCSGCGGSETFVSHHLVLPCGPRWDQAVRTALIGDWTAPLHEGGRIGPEVIGRIKSEARAIHRQLVPVWRRRVRGSRVLLLETPLAEDLTLLDLVAGELRMDDLVFESAFDDERVNAVLAGLDPAERRVAMAWAHPSIADWTEAARYAGAANPSAYGERVRRKLKRLGTHHTTRAQAAAATRTQAAAATGTQAAAATRAQAAAATGTQASAATGIQAAAVTREGRPS
jgi:hypothetical protein